MTVNFNVRENMFQGYWPTAPAPEFAPVAAPAQIVYAPWQQQQVAADALKGNVALGQGFADFLSNYELPRPAQPLTAEQQGVFAQLQGRIASLAAEPSVPAQAPPVVLPLAGFGFFDNF